MRKSINILIKNAETITCCYSILNQNRKSILYKITKIIGQKCNPKQVYSVKEIDRQNINFKLY